LNQLIGGFVIEFSEAEGSWRPLPSWARFLVDLGFARVSDRSQTRRITVVSMPDASAAAGLISLGAMRKCLELGDANDLDNHFQRIVSLARRRSPGSVLHHASWPGTFVIDEVDGDGIVWVRQQNRKDRRHSVTRKSAPDWTFIGEAHVAIRCGGRVPNADMYEHLVENGGAIYPSNLAVTDSGICLAGGVGGGESTRRRFADVRLRYGEGDGASLSELLTVQDWLPDTISRVMYFNSRTKEFDRPASQPQLVVADGDKCFLSLLDMPKFADSDVIGVIHRTMERQHLEAIGIKLASLRQCYEPDVSPRTPRGIAITALKRTN
jgi:hypothetical protein